MIHYHGLPITPETAAVEAIKSGHAFVSFKHKIQLGLAMEICQSFALDNGAFSSWKAGEAVADWSPYYKWVDELHRVPSFDFAVIPDVIDGAESDNDNLIQEWPWSASSGIGAPVWHLHESLERLSRLIGNFPRVCLGSSGEFSRPGSAKWWPRMEEAMEILCDNKGLPKCRIHGLRMLSPKIFTKLPFSSADSTNIARNVGIDKWWTGSYLPINKAAKAKIMRDKIESQQSPNLWQKGSSSEETISSGTN